AVGTTEGHARGAGGSAQRSAAIAVAAAGPGDPGLLRPGAAVAGDHRSGRAAWDVAFDDAPLREDATGGGTAGAEPLDPRVPPGGGVSPMRAWWWFGRERPGVECERGAYLCVRRGGCGRRGAFFPPRGRTRLRLRFRG